MPNYLRIAVTALCLTACVLQIALWVRSNKASARMQLDDFKVVSYKGWLHLQVYDDPGATFAWPYRTLFKAPHLIPVFVAAASATAPWIRWSNRFSLRTLLTATTLVAVGLGVIAVSN